MPAAEFDVDPAQALAFAANRRRHEDAWNAVSLPDLTVPQAHGDFDTDLEVMSSCSAVDDDDDDLLRQSRRRTYH